MPYELTDDDRQKLEPILLDLPKLDGKMSDLDIEKFLYLYSALPNKLPWTPILNSEANTQKIQSEQWDVQAEHLRHLQRRLNDGKIQAFDAQNSPTKLIEAGAYISREHAMDYLKSCGIHISQDEKDRFKDEPTLIQKSESNSSSSTETTPGITKIHLNQTAISNGERFTATSKSRSHKGTQTQWTDDELEKLFECHETQKKRYTNFTKRTAEIYGITATRVNALLTKRKRAVSEVGNPYMQLTKR